MHYPAIVISLLNAELGITIEDLMKTQLSLLYKFLHVLPYLNQRFLLYAMDLTVALTCLSTMSKQLLSSHNSGNIYSFINETKT